MHGGCDAAQLVYAARGHKEAKRVPTASSDR
jgi:hypothetical protein